MQKACYKEGGSHLGDTIDGRNPANQLGPGEKDQFFIGFHR